MARPVSAKRPANTPSVVFKGHQQHLQWRDARAGCDKRDTFNSFFAGGAHHVNAGAAEALATKR